MASKPGRKLNNWRSSYAKRLCRCVATHLYRDGHQKRDLVARFKRHLPDFQSYFDHPVTDDAIWMRGYLGSKPGYEHEHPDRDPESAVAWREARRLVDEKLSTIIYG